VPAPLHSWLCAGAIQNGGNVGIGTTNPTNTLSVNGTIQAKEVLVGTGWSDYVFEPCYRLKPLAEVAEYIQRQHHLPGTGAAWPATATAFEVSSGDIVVTGLPPSPFTSMFPPPDARVVHVYATALL